MCYLLLTTSRMSTNSVSSRHQRNFSVLHENVILYSCRASCTCSFTSYAVGAFDNPSAFLIPPETPDAFDAVCRSSHSTEQSQVTKSKIPSPSQLRTLPRRQLSYNSTDASAEHEESVNSASSTLSTCDVSSVSTPVLMVGEGEVDHAAAVEHALSGSTNQVALLFASRQARQILLAAASSLRFTMRRICCVHAAGL